jgi:uncharacterized protein
MNTAIQYIGKGWSFPPAFDLNIGSAKLSEGTDDINESLHILLSTTLGERIMQHTYGCDMNDMLFETINTSFKTYMVDRINTAILLFEPRITVADIELNEERINEGVVLVIINYVVNTTNSRYNYVFPFYKSEATELEK